jgi:hypothetical protein
VRQTFQWFRDHDVELPTNPIQGTQLVWKVPSQSLIGDILRNPFYAGAYVWGRRPIKTVLVDGRLEKRQDALHRAEECRVFIPEHHVGYIDWATYEESQRMIRRSSVNWQSDESMAAIREGQVLLVGAPLWALWPQAPCALLGRAVELTRAISAKATLTMAVSIALALVARLSIAD